MDAISLFSGIGGDTLAAQWAGFRTVQFVESEPFCQAVLRKHWPGVLIWSDIDDFKAERYRGAITLIYGGDPCQPSSLAGQRKGTEDDRYKWPEMLRVIHECQPTWVVNENPPGRLTMDFYQVLADMEGEGYATGAFIIPACAVNAPHRRDRVYIVAYSKLSTTTRQRRDSGGILSKSESEGPNMATSAIANAISQGLEEREKQDRLAQCSTAKRNNQSIADSYSGGQQQPQGDIQESGRWNSHESWNENWIEVATALCGMDDGLPDRVARLKALGNAQVPQQIYPIFKAIAEIEKANRKDFLLRCYS